MTRVIAQRLALALPCCVLPLQLCSGSLSVRAKVNARLIVLDIITSSHPLLGDVLFLLAMYVSVYFIIVLSEYIDKHLDFFQ